MSPEGLAVPLEDSDWCHPSSKSIVTFELFRDEYWPHFPQSLTKGLGTLLRCAIY